MKKTLQMTGCALGSGMIGYFANQLTGALGSTLFALGIALLVGSIVAMSHQENENS